MSPPLPGTEPFEHAGGLVGVLLCHGFTGSPQTLSSWADYPARHGFTVSLPRLPGHGTTWQDLARTELAGLVRRGGPGVRRAGEPVRADLRLRAVHGRLPRAAPGRSPRQRGARPGGGQPVAGPGHQAVPARSGAQARAASAARHRERHQEAGRARDRLRPVPVRAAATLPRLWDVTTRQLGDVTQPVLVYRSAVDHVVGPASMKVLLAGLPEDQVTVREMRRQLSRRDARERRGGDLRGQREVRAGSRRIGGPIPGFILPAADRGRLSWGAGFDTQRWGRAGLG